MGRRFRRYISSFHQFASARIWQSGCETSIDIQFIDAWYEMLGELVNIPTGTLIDMLFVILTGELSLTANHVAEIEQIQRELQSRGEGRFRTLLDERNPRGSR